MAFFAEWEDSPETGSTYPVSTNMTTFSNGKGKAVMKTDATMQYSFEITNPGMYRITIPYKNTNNKDRDHTIIIDDLEGDKTTIKSGASGIYTNELNLSSGSHTVKIKCNYSLTSVFDYILVECTDIPLSVSTSGLSTYCPAVPLDFTNTTTIEAYKASTVAGDKVSLTKASTVAAGEGVLLRAVDGGEATESIPVMASAEKATDNMFVGTLEDITIQQIVEGNTNYVLSNTNGVTGFYKAKSEGQLVPAGKAWLPVPTASAAKGFTLQFDGQTTGISEINANQQGDNRCYTLSGVQVNNPQTKGIYVKNGKKVVVK